MSRPSVKQTSTQHPAAPDLAAWATGDINVLRRFTLERHIHDCERCQAEIAAFRAMRAELLQAEMPKLDWDTLSSEMRANIHLGLEAGACVRVTRERAHFSPGLAVAFASLLLLAGAGILLRDYRPQAPVSQAPVSAAPVSVEATAPPVTPTPEYRIPVLESSTHGIEMRTGPASFALLNREGGAASQTVSAQGAVRSRDFDADAGSVTIKDVYLQ